MPPRPPQGSVLRLPPILRMHHLVSRPGCSKAPRGLFVLSWVTRIFTGTSISPSPLLRQCSSRYSLRAGRNLPDKEFRYLRTVIVTAAVHRGFASWLRSPLRLTFRHWAGVSPYTSACALAETCVFGKQSLEPFHCGPLVPRSTERQTTRAPLLPKVRGQFAEFLNRGSLVHLGGCPPAYRCRCAVRAEVTLASGFSRRPGSRELPSCCQDSCARSGSCVGDFPPTRPRCAQPTLSIRWAPLPYRVPASLFASRSGAGLSNLLAIAYDCYVLGLGPD